MQCMWASKATVKVKTGPNHLRRIRSSHICVHYTRATQVWVVQYFVQRDSQDPVEIITTLSSRIHPCRTSLLKHTVLVHCMTMSTCENCNENSSKLCRRIPTAVRNFTTGWKLQSTTTWSIQCSTYKFWLYYSRKRWNFSCVDQRGMG